MGLIELLFPVFVAVYVLVVIALVVGGLWAVVKLGIFIRLPELIGRFAAQIVESYRAYRE